MNSHDPQETQSAATTEPLPASENLKQSPIAMLGRMLGLAFVGLLSAALATLAIRATGEVFVLPSELAKLGEGRIPSPQEQQLLSEGNRVLQSKHAALWLGIAGALIGGLFGLAAGGFQRSGKSVLKGLAVGAICGCLSGGLAGPLAIYLDAKIRASIPTGELSPPDYLVMLMHAATWAVLGIGTGFGVSLVVPASQRSVRNSFVFMVLSSMAGGLGALLYFVLGAMLLPLANTSLPIPAENSARILWMALPSCMMGLVYGRQLLLRSSNQ